MGSIYFPFFLQDASQQQHISMLFSYTYSLLYHVNDNVHAQMFLSFINISMLEHRFLTHILHGCILNTKHNIHLHNAIFTLHKYTLNTDFIQTGYTHTNRKLQQQICNHHGGSRWPLVAGAWCFSHGGMAMRFQARCFKSLGERKPGKHRRGWEGAAPKSDAARIMPISCFLPINVVAEILLIRFVFGVM